MKRLEGVVGKKIPERQGEWTDWWANGTASAPREVTASRHAKRLLTAARSPLWGPMEERASATAADIEKELCLFDEHTWGSADSVAQPYALDTQGQFAAKASYAYQAWARAELLLSQRVRTRLAGEPEGLYVANASAHPISDWVWMPVTALRSDYRSVEAAKPSRKEPLRFEAGYGQFQRPEKAEDFSPDNTAATFPDNRPRQRVRFWAEGVPAKGVVRYQLQGSEAKETKPSPSPSVKTDASGWPTSIGWEGTPQPLFVGQCGEFTALKIDGLGPRWIAKDIFGAAPAQREALRKEKIQKVVAQVEKPTEVRDNPHTVVYSQRLRHPSLAWATRELEVWKREPRARLTFRLDRRASDAPEIYVLGFDLPPEAKTPQTSCGGAAFVPFTDQLPGTCRDYFAIDGWVHYPSAQQSWVWVSRDAPLVSFGDLSAWANRQEPPANQNRALAMVFNNFWYTNFLGNAHGVMEFQFDLACGPRLDSAAAAATMAESLTETPHVLIQPGPREDPIVIERLYRP
jgi:hypothetical protein